MSKSVSCTMFVSLVTAILFATPFIATAADATARVDVNSAYVWRGITYNDGIVVQPSLDVGATSNLTINVWGNFNVDDYDGSCEKNEFSEVDATVSYSVSAGPVDFELGYAEYLYPHQADTNGEASPGTREIYLGAEVPVVGDLSVQGKVCYDVDEYDGFYASLGLVYGASFMDEALSAELGASAGYADKNWAEGNSGGTQAGFNEYNVSVAVEYEISDGVACGANVGYTDSLDEDVLPDQDVDFYGGVSMSVGF